MRQPHLEVIPLRPAVRSDAPVTLDVLIKITPPAAELNAPRPALNLGLVLDRSGSIHRLAKEGVSATTMGLGDDYNEDLLEAMAQAGDGNYYYIEHPQPIRKRFFAQNAIAA